MLCAIRTIETSPAFVFSVTNPRCLRKEIVDALIDAQRKKKHFALLVEGNPTIIPTFKALELFNVFHCSSTVPNAVHVVALSLTLSSLNAKASVDVQKVPSNLRREMNECDSEDDDDFKNIVPTAFSYLSRKFPLSGPTDISLILPTSSSPIVTAKSRLVSSTVSPRGKNASVFPPNRVKEVLSFISNLDENIAEKKKGFWTSVLERINGSSDEKVKLEPHQLSNLLDDIKKRGKHQGDEVVLSNDETRFYKKWMSDTEEFKKKVALKNVKGNSSRSSQPKSVPTAAMSTLPKLEIHSEDELESES